MTKKKKLASTIDKPVMDLQTFIQKINKKDKRNGLRVKFGWKR